MNQKTTSKKRQMLTEENYNSLVFCFWLWEKWTSIILRDSNNVNNKNNVNPNDTSVPDTPVPLTPHNWTQCYNLATSRTKWYLEEG